MVIAPHPDDETLGCGGTLLRLAREGAEIAWLIVTSMSEDGGFAKESIALRAQEIAKVSELYGFSAVFQLNVPTRQLDRIPLQQLIGQFSSVFKSFNPNQIFLPHWRDVHTDHRAVFDAAAACSKWFRYNSVERVMAYETLSETEFALGGQAAFQPNFFVDVTHFLERKIEIMTVYQSEMSEFPFPRSAEAIRALARFRGASSGFGAAEAFQLLRERY